MKLSLIWDVVTVLMILFGIMTAGHALINKRDPKGAFGWIAVCIVFPFIGPFFYIAFGINRVQRRAKKLLQRSSAFLDNECGEVLRPDGCPAPVPVVYASRAKIADRVSRWPVCSENRVTLLHNGEDAYPAMLEAIACAQRSIYLATYIFDVDKTGESFITALNKAHKRGVPVRVLVDGVGEMHWGTVATRSLREKGIPVARYLPPTLFPPAFYINLRNHRKILVVDGEQAFTGGMNISDRHLVHAEGNADSRTTDIHFRLEGPVARQIEDVFIEDWQFVTGEILSPHPFPAGADGDSLCRVISDGPDEEMGNLYMVLSGVISSAKQNIRIMTPYFLPPRGIMTALQTAALRGVCIEVVLPEKNDSQFVHWATRNLLWELLAYDARIYYQPPPFAHTKLLLVDDNYVQVGSANIDARSLRLNFELNVEIYDQSMAQLLTNYFQNIKSRCRTVTLEEVDNRPLPERLRDSFAWLFSSYL